MLSDETVLDVDQVEETLLEQTGSLLKQMLWRTANYCLLGGLLTWPLERDWVRIEKLTMVMDNLGWECDGTRLAHISDLHCGTLVHEKHLHRYVEMINSFDVDFVVITGDFITTGSRRHAQAVARALSDLRPGTAVVACLGNHDYGLWHPNGIGMVKGMADFLCEKLSDAGVIVLRNESRAFFRGEAVLQFVAAVEKVTDQALLAKMGMWIRPELTSTVTDQALIAKIVVEGRDVFVRRAAVQKLTDQALLAKIATAEKNEPVRTAAFKRIKELKSGNKVP